ncbi:MAG TPA: hypothetical protein VIG42_05530 [Solirubrobacteraceae bacterium]
MDYPRSPEQGPPDDTRRYEQTEQDQLDAEQQERYDDECDHDEREDDEHHSAQVVQVVEVWHAEQGFSRVYPPPVAFVCLS